MLHLFRFKSIVGIGVGAGAYILAKFAVSLILTHLLEQQVLCLSFRHEQCFSQTVNPRRVSLCSADLPWPGGGFSSAQHWPQWQRLDRLGCHQGTWKYLWARTQHHSRDFCCHSVTDGCCPSSCQDWPALCLTPCCPICSVRWVEVDLAELRHELQVFVNVMRSVISSSVCNSWSCLQEELMNNTELVQSYRQQINNTVNQFNLQLFWNMYNRWNDMFSSVHLL